MYFDSKKTSIIISAITAMMSSRAMFAFFDDPEGPNLLIVTVLAAVVYFLALAIALLFPAIKQASLKRLLSLIFIQIIIVTAFYFGLNFV